MNYPNPESIHRDSSPPNTPTQNITDRTKKAKQRTEHSDSIIMILSNKRREVQKIRMSTPDDMKNTSGRQIYMALKVSNGIPRQASVRCGAKEQFQLEILGENAAGNQTKRNKGRKQVFFQPVFSHYIKR